MTTCLPDTGAPELAVLSVIGVLLMIAGVLLVVRARRGGAPAAALGAVLLCAGPGAALLGQAGQAADASA